MAAVLTGTPTAVTWASGSDPAGQSITIPADATAVYMLWTYYASGTGHGLASSTLNGNAPGQTFEYPMPGGYKVAAGVAAWYNPATGSQTLDVSWDASPSNGPTTIVAYVKDGDTTAWRDADALSTTESTAISVTLDTVSGDLVLKHDMRFSGSVPPANSSGWTSSQTQNNNSESARLAYISATGATQACPAEDEFYSVLVALSIPAGGAAATSLPLPRRMARMSSHFR